MANARLLMASFSMAAMTAVAACSGGSGVGNEGRELSSDADRSKSMTIAGCLQAGDPAGTFVLRATDASVGDGAQRDDRGLGTGGEAIGTSGSGGTGGASAGGRDATVATPTGTFGLIAGAGENLGQYMGQQVRVKGQIADGPGAAGQATYAQFFRVTEIEKVADRCAGQEQRKDRK